MFKSFLIAGGHPNPDKPGDVKTIEGLTASVYVGMGKPYQKNGETKQYPEIKSFDSASSDDSSSSVDDKLDDDIPF